MSLLAASLLSAPGLVVVQADTSLVSFQYGPVDSRLAGGSWAVKNETVVGGLLQWVTLKSGELPTPGGALTVSIPRPAISVLDPAHPLGSDVFMLTAFAPIDATHGIFANGVEVRPAGEVVGGSVTTFHPVVEEVATYASTAAADAASSCPSCQPSENPGHLAATDSSGKQVFNPQPAQTLRGPAPRTSAPIAPSPNNPVDVWVRAGTGNPTDSVPSPGGPAAGNPLAPTEQAVQNKLPTSPPCLPVNCAQTAGSTAQPVGQCDSYSQGAASHYNCVKAAYNFGVESFRGWANKTAGMVDTFQEQYSNTETWDTAYRSSTGPFSVNGSSQLQYTQQQVNTWDTDGDCWDPNNQPPSTGDSPAPCGYQGWWSDWGNDTWRWEKHEDTICGGADPQCQTITYETLFDYVNNGGNQYNPDNGKNGDLEQPNQVHTGGDPYGNWVEYDPSDNVDTMGWLNSATYQYSNTIDISYPEAYSSTTFNSSMTDSTSNKITNTYKFRGPNQGIAWGGHYWSYDGSTDQSGWTPWSWRFWTCSFNSGYWGALDSYEAGGTNSDECWDYTLA